MLTNNEIVKHYYDLGLHFIIPLLIAQVPSISTTTGTSLEKRNITTIILESSDSSTTTATMATIYHWSLGLFDIHQSKATNEASNLSQAHRHNSYLLRIRPLRQRNNFDRLLGSREYLLFQHYTTECCNKVKLLRKQSLFYAVGKMLIP